MNPAPLPELPCGSLGPTSRALTQFYEQALRPVGLRAWGRTILEVLARAGQVSGGSQLGEMLAIDSTNLTRTLRIMSRKGWIAERPGRDRRVPWLCLASAGESKLMRVVPVWEKVQPRVRPKSRRPAWRVLCNSRIKQQT
jgi:DNA-binding MarR family transcriptional regulator